MRSMGCNKKVDPCFCMQKRCQSQRPLSSDVSFQQPIEPSLPHNISTMSPHKVEALPSAAALPSYGISKNGFLPANAPLIRLPNDYYHPWESIIEVLPTLIETRQIRQRVDELPILDTSHLETEAEWQRAYSMLAVITQGYVWQGPEPSEVSPVQPFHWCHRLLISNLALTSRHLRTLSESC